MFAPRRGPRLARDIGRGKFVDVNLEGEVNVSIFTTEEPGLENKELGIRFLRPQVWALLGGAAYQGATATSPLSDLVTEVATLRVAAYWDATGESL